MKKTLVCPYLVWILTVMIIMVSSGPFLAKIIGETEIVVSIMIVFSFIIDIFLVVFFVILMPKRFGCIIIKKNTIRLFWLFKEKTQIDLNKEVYYIISDAMVFRSVYKEYIFVSNQPISYKQFGNGLPTIEFSKVCLNYDWNSVIAIPYSNKIKHIMDISAWVLCETEDSSLS